MADGQSLEGAGERVDQRIVLNHLRAWSVTLARMTRVGIRRIAPGALRC